MKRKNILFVMMLAAIFMMSLVSIGFATPNPYLSDYYLSDVHQTHDVVEFGTEVPLSMYVKSDYWYPNAWLGFYDADTEALLDIFYFEISAGQEKGFGPYIVITKDPLNILVKTGWAYPVVTDSMDFTVCTVTPADYGAFHHEWGDVNEDQYIDVFDLSIVSLAYGSFKGDPNYNEIADLNHDDVVDMRDLSRVSIHWGDGIYDWKVENCGH